MEKKVGKKEITFFLTHFKPIIVNEYRDNFIAAVNLANKSRPTAADQLRGAHTCYDFSLAVGLFCLRRVRRS